MSDPRELMAIAEANEVRRRCICQEETDAPLCDCPVPVTREQVDRLQAYVALQPDRAVIYSELIGEWLAALHAFLPESDDPIEAWLREPYDLPPAADLHHASDLGELLDMLGAPAGDAASWA